MHSDDNTASGSGANSGNGGWRWRVEAAIENIRDLIKEMRKKFALLFKSLEILGLKAVRNEERIKGLDKDIEKLATKESVTAVQAQLQDQIKTVKEDQDKLATKEAVEKAQEAAGAAKKVADAAKKAVDTITNGDRKGSLLVGGGSGVVAGGGTFGALKLLEWLATLPIFN